MNKIFDIEFTAPQKLSGHFDEVLVDDDYGYWESKETFHHEEENLNFDFKYVIEYGVSYGKQPQGCYQLVIIPTKEFWHKSIMDAVCACSGIEPDDANIMDACAYGSIIPLGCNHVEPMSDDEREPNQEVLDAIASVYQHIESLRGFYFDRPMNGLGNTGWDYLRHILHGEELF